ncbi:MAG: ABC transporter permease [Treponema sp.]|jgi:putative ABC transport system permease protein|nr:ABC transporter permease [Treponema sp.]
MKQNKKIILMRVAARNVRRSPRRTALCVSAVGLAVFFVIFLHSFMQGMVDNIEATVRAFDTGDLSAASRAFEEEKEFMPVQYPVGEAAGLSADELCARVKTIAGVRHVFPRITAYASLESSKVKHAFLWGLKIDEESAAWNFNMSDHTNGLVEGRFPDPDKNECAVGTRFAQKSGLGIGDEVLLNTITAHYSDRIWAPVITGIFNFDYAKYDGEAILVQYDRLERLLGMEDGAQQLFVFCEKPRQNRAVAKALSALLGDGDVIREWEDNYYVVMMRQSMAIMLVLYLVFVGVASFLIVNTVLMIIHERIKEIGMMGSLGMTRLEITSVFFFESLFLSILGALAGSVLGGIVCLVGSFFPIDFNTFTGGGMKDMPVSGTLVLSFDWGILAQGFCMGVLIASLCTLIPSLKSAFVEPVEALRR